MNRQLGKIAVDLTPILPGGENGGAKIFVLELLQGLAKLAPKTQFVLLTQAASHQELAALDAPNMRRVMVAGSAETNLSQQRLRKLGARILPRLPGRLRGMAARLGYWLNARLKRSQSGALLNDLQADLLFCPFTAPTYFEPGVPTVCTIYDLQYKTYPEFFSPEDLAHRDRTFVDACRRATMLAAISDYSRESAIRHGNLDPQRIRTIHLRMARRIAQKGLSDPAILSKLSLNPRRYLIYPANFWKHKNHEMLLTAFAMACRTGLDPDIKLVCTGAPGARQKWLLEAAAAFGLASRILFPGYLRNSELATLMSSSAGVVFPSLYEGFGLPVIEAMAAHVPVACSNATSLPEVAAGASILFDPRVPTQIAAAIVALVRNAEQAAQLVRAGRQRAIEFSDSDRMAQEYWQLFQSALSSGDKANVMTGAYVDGWAGHCLNIQLTPSAGMRTLEIEFSAPAWLPKPTIVVQVREQGRRYGERLVLKRGANELLSLRVEEAGGRYEISIGPTFVPSEYGHGDDQRELSAMVSRCGIMHANGSYESLFPEEAAR